MKLEKLLTEECGILDRRGAEDVEAMSLQQDWFRTGMISSSRHWRKGLWRWSARNFQRDCGQGFVI